MKTNETEYLLLFDFLNVSKEYNKLQSTKEENIKLSPFGIIGTLFQNAIRINAKTKSKKYYNYMKSIVLNRVCDSLLNRCTPNITSLRGVLVGIDPIELKNISYICTNISDETVCMNEREYKTLLAKVNSHVNLFLSSQKVINSNSKCKILYEEFTIRYFNSLQYYNTVRNNKKINSFLTAASNYSVLNSHIKIYTIDELYMVDKEDGMIALDCGMKYLYENEKSIANSNGNYEELLKIIPEKTLKILKSIYLNSSSVLNERTIYFSTINMQNLFLDAELFSSSRRTRISVKSIIGKKNNDKKPVEIFRQIVNEEILFSLFKHRRAPHSEFYRLVAQRAEEKYSELREKLHNCTKEIEEKSEEYIKQVKTELNEEVIKNIGGIQSLIRLCKRKHNNKKVEKLGVRIESLFKEIDETNYKMHQIHEMIFSVRNGYKKIREEPYLSVAQKAHILNEVKKLAVIFRLKTTDFQSPLVNPTEIDWKQDMRHATIEIDHCQSVNNSILQQNKSSSLYYYRILNVVLFVGAASLIFYLVYNLFLLRYLSEYPLF